MLEQYAPLNTTEFGSYITKLKSADADGLFAVEYGADGVAFVNQGAQFKLFDQYKTVLGFNMVSEPLFKVLGDKVVGFYNNLGYDARVRQPDEQGVRRRVDGEGGQPALLRRGRQLPRRRRCSSQAVKKAKSVDPAKVKAAMNGLSFDSIAGQVTMGKDHQLVRPSYVGQVVDERRRARLEGRRRGRRRQDPSRSRPGLQGLATGSSSRGRPALSRPPTGSSRPRQDSQREPRPAAERRRPRRAAHDPQLRARHDLRTARSDELLARRALHAGGLPGLRRDDQGVVLAGPDHRAARPRRRRRRPRARLLPPAPEPLAHRGRAW